ncbi:MAG: hypothetical protein ACLVJ6_16750 [Merdibacter sp.]
MCRPRSRWSFRRRPQLGKVLVRSVFDRTLFVLGRAITVAAPAGILLWVMANVGIRSVAARLGVGIPRSARPLHGTGRRNPDRLHPWIPGNEIVIDHHVA